MSGTDILNVAMRVGHVGSAIVLVGATLFVLLALLPAVREDEESPLVRKAIKRFVPLLHASVAVLLITGFYNFYQNTELYKLVRPTAHMVMGIKMLLGLIVIVLTFVGYSKMVKKPAFWLSLHVVLSVAVIVLGAVVRHLRIGALQMAGAG